MKRHLQLSVLGFVLLASCIQQPASQKPLTSLSKEIKEINPGILEEYLSKGEIPNSFKMVFPTQSVWY